MLWFTISHRSVTTVNGDYPRLTDPLKSTVGFNPGFDSSQRTPEETQFVNLLKSKWILDILQSSSQLTAVGTASLWAGALRELKLVSSYGT